MINRICDDFNRTIRGELQKIHGDLRHAYGRVTVPGYRTLLNEWFGIYPVALELNASGAQPMYYNTFIDNNDGPGNGEIWPHTTVAKTFFNLLTLPPTIGMLHLDFRNQILRNENLEWVILSHMQFSFPYSILYKLFFPDEPLPFWVEAGWELRLHKEQ